MAKPNSNQFYDQGNLSPGQEHLLMAALNSNNPNAQNTYSSDQDFKASTAEAFDPNQQFPLDGINPAFFQSQPNGVDFSTFDNLEESPYVDFLDGDTSFDFDASLNDNAMIGGLPGASASPDGDEQDNAEKRKSPEDDVEDPDGGGKRREPEDKTAKKPGRKPLTSEPTTKRKAQNRAAQRAFRERKEKHLQDLETKVAELEKVSDATNHENGLLKAQVQRLQTELREYRKRLSLNSSSVNRSPTGNNVSFLSSMGGANNFQFEFPRFGGLPGAHMLNNGPLGTANGLSGAASARPGMGLGNGTAQRQSSNGSNGSIESPRSLSNGVASPDKKVSSPQVRAAQQSQPSATNPSFFNGTNTSPLDIGNSPNLNGDRARTGSSSAQSRVFQFNSRSNSTTDSPSASSVSQYGGANSSCGTSPEPTHNSPTTGKADSQLDASQGYVCHGDSEGEVTFCEKLNMACGNPRNPVPRAKSNGTLANPAAKTTADANDNSGLDFLAGQNGGQFDPTLFGDYRDPQAAIVGDGDFTGGFFDDAFNFGTYGSPFASFGGDGATPAAAIKINPITEIERMQDGLEDEVVPGEDPAKFLNCHKIWDKLAQRPDFKDGTIDIDNLCTELRAKARCSESGVVVDDHDVEAALKRLPAADRA